MNCYSLSRWNFCRDRDYSLDLVCMKYYKTILLLLPLFYSCSVSENGYDYSPEELPSHPFVEEARAYFEEYASTPMEYETHGLHPGAIAAQWNDKLKIFSHSGTLCINVELSAEATYDLELVKKNVAGTLSTEDTYTTAVYQRLIVVKGEESGLMSCYIVTIIPDEEHATMNRAKVGEMVYCADPMTRFNGFLLFSTVTTNFATGLQCYKDGDMYRDISIFNLPSITWSGWDDTAKEISKFLGIKSFTRHIPAGAFVIPAKENE